jgi:hypothetical protein
MGRLRLLCARSNRIPYIHPGGQDACQPPRVTSRPPSVPNAESEQLICIFEWVDVQAGCDVLVPTPMLR